MSNKSKKILSEISAGELLDKISILEIKLKEVKDKNDQEEVRKEYEILKKTQNSSIVFTDKINDLFKLIKEINSELWIEEDKLRIFEKNKDFGESFIETARSIYAKNDKRARIKAEINNAFGSNIREIKQYVNY